MKQKRITLSLLLLLLMPSLLLAQRSLSEIAESADDGFNFIIVADVGRNGYYDQQTIADAMGIMADEGDAEFILALGDTFHYMGVQSVEDPIWLSNFEQVYRHPELMISWFPVIGNHESQGNIQALIDYSDISRRWEMPARYYVKHFEGEEGETIDLFIIDTCPLIEKYRQDPKYIGVVGQEREPQLAWLEEELAKSTADFKIVAGHHPIHAHTSKDQIERDEMQKYVEPLLIKYDVDLYLAGHIHNHQHIRLPHSNTDYVVLSSGSRSRKVEAIEGTQFCSSETGFGFISIKNKVMTVHLLDKEANELYSFTRQ